MSPWYSHSCIVIFTGYLSWCVNISLRIFTAGHKRPSEHAKSPSPVLHASSCCRTPFSGPLFILPQGFLHSACLKVVTFPKQIYSIGHQPSSSPLPLKLSNFKNYVGHFILWRISSLGIRPIRETACFLKCAYYGNFYIPFYWQDNKAFFVTWYSKFFYLIKRYTYEYIIL